MIGRGLLLDTHAAIWMMEGSLSDATREMIVEASVELGVFVSPITGWEIGLLARPTPSGRSRIAFQPDPQSWYARLIALPGVGIAPFDGAIAIASSQLPGEFHGDPTDRMLVSTARAMNLPLLTRDQKILDYARAGHVQAIAC